MRVFVKGTKIELSEAPPIDVPDGLLVRSPKLLVNKDMGLIMTLATDIRKGQKTYNLPAKLTKKDVTGIYLRML